MSLHRVHWRTALIVILGSLALAGCRFPVELFFAPDTPPPSQVEPLQPTPTSPAGSEDSTNQTPTSTTPPCAYAQAEQPLPEITARVQDSLNNLGLGAVEALAVAYGENCVDTLNNKIISFQAIETDFFFTVVVPDTQDKAALGRMALRLLAVAEKFPPGDVPGPNLGYLTIVFQDSKGDARLRSRIADAVRVRDSGLGGADFYSAAGGT